MYEDRDPYLNELRDICLRLPESTEVEAWGRPTFRAGKKLFVIFGSGHDAPYSMIFKPSFEDSESLRQDSRIFVPPYFGPSGWLALDFDAARVDWDEVTELVEESYRQVALKRMLTALDGGE